MMVPLLGKCCFCWSIREGSIVIAVLGIVADSISSILLVAALSLWGTVEKTLIQEDPDYTKEDTKLLFVLFMVLLSITLLHLVTCVLLLFGVKQLRRYFLLPWLVWTTLDLGFSVISVLFDMKGDAASIITALLVLSLSIAFTIYCLLCVFSYYVELRQMRLTHGGAPIHYAKSEDQ